MNKLNDVVMMLDQVIAMVSKKEFDGSSKVTEKLQSANAVIKEQLKNTALTLKPRQSLTESDAANMMDSDSYELIQRILRVLKSVLTQNNIMKEDQKIAFSITSPTPSTPVAQLDDVSNINNNVNNNNNTNNNTNNSNTTTDGVINNPDTANKMESEGNKEDKDSDKETEEESSKSTYELDPPGNRKKVVHTHPEEWKKIVNELTNSTKYGGKGWNARKAQAAVRIYKQKGYGYK